MIHTNLNIIHRDLKPENILLHNPSMKINKPKKDCWDQQCFTEKVQIKICDLGLSKPIELKGTETFCGSPSFISPENLLGNTYDFKADVWALGSLTFELMIGRSITDFFDPTKKGLDAKFIDGIIYVPKVEKMSIECIDFL